MQLLIYNSKILHIYLYIYIYIYIISHVLTFSRSHHYALIFFRGLFFLLPLCSRSHAFTPSHSLFAFKSKKHIPLCSHFFSISHFFFLSLSHFFNIFFFIIISLCSHFFFSQHIFFSQSHQHFSTSFFFLMLSLCSHASIFFIFSFFISVSGGSLTRLTISSTFSNFNINFSKSFIAIHFLVENIFSQSDK